MNEFILLGLFFVVGFSIATTVLANRKGRNPINWFFLSLFWGFLGLIILACSKNLEEEESDSLAKTLWIIILIPLILLAIFFYNTNKQKELQRNYQIEKTITTETEIKVDLNDYFNSSIGWDDNTDWNCTDFGSEETYQAFNKVLKDNNIYWSEQKNCWVKKVGKNNKPPKAEFE